MSGSTSSTTAAAGDSTTTTTDAQQQQQVEQQTAFEAVTSQEALDRIISQRLAREKSKYADYDDLKAKAKKFDEAEEATKSEIQRERDKREAAEKRAQELEAAQTRRDLAEKVSAEKRVPVQLLMRGGGDTEESMEAYADEILAYRNGGDPKPGVVKKSGTDGDNKDKATSSVAAGRERFEARRNKNKSS